MWIDNGNVYYDRAIIKKIYGSGFHLINDLQPFYHMLMYLKKYDNLSKQARQRLKWFDYYHKCENAGLTCRYFGISRKTFYKWQKIYDPSNLYTLEDQSKTPINKRQREITSEQEMRIVQLRKEHIRYSKIKLAKIYPREYEEPISSWKIQKVIEKHKLYHNPKKTAKITKNGFTRRKRNELPN